MPLQDPGRAAAWSGSYSTTGFSYDASRELFAAVYDKAAIAGQTLIGEQRSRFPMRRMPSLLFLGLPELYIIPSL